MPVNRLTYLLFLALIIVIVIPSYGANGPEDESKTDVVILYPHFFQNTRTLIGTLDKILFDQDEKKVFVYLSNEYNPSYYYTCDEAQMIRQSLTHLSGNLVPDFDFDIKNIIGNAHYKNLVDSVASDKLHFHFFVPGSFIKHIDAPSGNEALNQAYTLGIIPKKIYSPVISEHTTIYIPESDPAPKTTTNFGIIIREI